MRLVLVGLLLPLAACVSAPPAPQAAGVAAVVADVGPVAAPRPPITSPPNSTVQVDAEAEPKQVCWTEIVTGTRGRKQTVCRNERTERDNALMRKDFKTFQDRASGTQPQTLGGAGG
jgi:hypothetical protein